MKGPLASATIGLLLLACGDSTGPQNTFEMHGTVVSQDGPVPDAYVSMAYTPFCWGECREPSRQFTAISDSSGSFHLTRSIPAGHGCNGRWEITATHRHYFEVSREYAPPSGQRECPFAVRGLRIEMEAYFPLRILTDSLPPGRVGLAYSAVLKASRTRDGGPRWAVIEGALPPGLELGFGGWIEGTPQTPGIWVFTVEATTLNESDGSARADLSIAVARGGA